MTHTPTPRTLALIGFLVALIVALLVVPPLFFPTDLATPATPVVAALFPPKTTSVMAWLYPDTPGCSAPREYRTFESIDVLKPEYFTLADDGALILLTEDAYGCGAFSPSAAADVRAHSKKQFATVSGSADSMRAMLESPQMRAEALAALVSFTGDTGFTGVEIDFEGFGAWDSTLYASYRSFLRELGTRLHALDKELMVDVPPIGTTLEQSYYQLTYKDMAGLPIDYIVIMAYDYQYDYGAGSAIAPNAWVKNVVRHAKKEIRDLDRIVIGIPSYGYQGATGGYDIRRLSGVESARLSGFATARYDARSHEHMWSRGSTSYVYIDSAGLTAKRALIESMGIRHVSIWSLGGNAWFANPTAGE